MGAPIGNQFWKARSTHGRSPLFASPEQLEAACLEYFEWVEANPLYESKPFSYEGKITMARVPKARAMTISGMCIFLDITPPTWRDYASKNDFSFVCTRIEEAIRTQKFELASADLLNASIIARDLGLADKRELKATVSEMDEKEIDERLKKLIAQSSGDDDDGDA